MLQKYSVQEGVPPPPENRFFLTPAYVISLVKRRILYFLVPFVLVFSVGAVMAWMVPPVYYSGGKILVEGQQIPSDLVRPTVSALANERIQVIEQRIMTRDNLMAIANKFQLFSGTWQKLTASEMIDAIRASAVIRPLALTLPSRDRNLTIAFTVGFEHERPDIAMKVASEIVTMILSEDVRVRTNYAAETTKFLARELQRLDGELNAVELKLAELKRKQIKVPQGPSDAQIITLKAELAEKAARYSDAHPDMKAIKQRLEVLEKSVVEPKQLELGIDALERQRETLEESVQATSRKLSAARLGESLERGQQSERLEVIEQPSLPHVPIKPNRRKALGMALMVAMAAGGGLVFVLEALGSTIHRKEDLVGLVDSHLLVPIPYIVTKQEMLRRRYMIRLGAIAGVVMLFAGAAVVFFLLPPLDVLLSKYAGMRM